MDLQQLLATPNSVLEQHDMWQNVAYMIRSAMAAQPEIPAEPATRDWVTFQVRPRTHGMGPRRNHAGHARVFAFGLKSR